MKQVASLQYGVIFKKAFSDVEVFKGFVRDILGINLEITTVETEKEFQPTIGHIKIKFDLYAEDTKNHVIVEIQHQRNIDHYDRFLHYHCVALLDQAQSSHYYRPPATVYTIVVLTSGDKHQADVAVIDFDPKRLDGTALQEIKHKIIYLCPKYVDQHTPQSYREWLTMIHDSLDKKMDEAQYNLPEIQKVITRITEDGITPEERARLIEESYVLEAEQRGMNEGMAQGFTQGVAYGVNQGIAQGIEKGIAQGVDKGKLEGKLEIAKQLLQKQFDLETISIITGLSQETILHNIKL